MFDDVHRRFRRNRTPPRRAHDTLRRAAAKVSEWVTYFHEVMCKSPVFPPYSPFYPEQSTIIFYQIMIHHSTLFCKFKGVDFIGKTNRTVVRNQAYRRGSLNVRERHNERKNENYFNADIISERANLNYYFKKCEGTYEQNFDKLLADGAISMRGLKPDAKIVDEFIFDVNTEYFERNGGYNYAKNFFEEAYRLAVKEVGNEDYILSAVMHTDEKNTALSQELGRDVFHYHLHVVYIPVIEKEVYYKKNNKNPELAGKLKEVIHQVSHSKKWPRQIQLDENGEPVKSKTGKTVLINSYSLLQDRFYNHMREAGYDGFERGERGSTAEHLSDLEYKTMMETERAANITATIENLKNNIQEKETKVAELDKTAEKKTERIAKLEEKIDDRNFAVADIKEINKIGKAKNMFGQIVVTPEELDYIKSFAREGATSAMKIKELEKKVTSVERERDYWKKQYNILFEKATLFLDALKHAPKRVMEFLADIMRKPPEQENIQKHTKTKSQEEII